MTDGPTTFARARPARNLGLCAKISACTLAAVLGPALACGSETDPADPEASPGTPGTAMLLGELMPEDLCRMPEVVQITILATRIGCEPGPPAPCTLPADPQPVAGDIATCPVTDPVRLLGVEVSQAGRYQVEAVGELTTGESVAHCFSAADGDPEIVVTAADLDAGRVIDLQSSGEACPS